MSTSRSMKVFDYICDTSLLIFFPVLVVLGTNEKEYFIPVEILFLSVFAMRFFVKRSRLSIYTIWTIGLAILALVSTMYAPNHTSAMRWAISVIQVSIFGNLLVPYFRDDKRNVHIFFFAFLIAISGLGIRLWLSAPLEQLMNTRLGESIGVNANHVGFLFIIGSLICLYYAVVEMKWMGLPFFLLLAGIGLFSGSRKAILMLLVGIVLLLTLSSRKPRNAIIALFASGLIVLGILWLSFYWEPLKNVLGVRIEGLISAFTNGQGDASTEERIAMTQFGYEMFWDKPVLGWGLHAFSDISHFAVYSHNNYIEILISWGFVGFVWYYLFLILTIARGIWLLFSQKRTKLVVFSVAILLILCMDDFGRVRFYDEVSHILYALCYAVTVSHLPAKGIDIVSLLIKSFQRLRHSKIPTQV